MKNNDFCELTIKLDEWLYDELESYLISLKGIVAASVKKSTVYVKYDCSLMNYNWIKLEILAFLEYNYPIILEFDKHSKNNISKYEFVIDDYCCEYCLKSNIEYLLSIEGIEKVYSSYSTDETRNVKISIYYDKNVITEQNLKTINSIFTDEAYVFDDNLNWNIEIQTARYSSIKDNIIDEEVICFNFNTINKRGNHINVCIKTNLPIQMIQNMTLNNKINANNFITDFFCFFEEKPIPNKIYYDRENVILEKKSDNLYSLNVNFKIINLILKKDFKLK